MKKTITLFILLFTLCLGQMWGDMYLAGTMNSWSGDNVSYKFADNKLEVELDGSTTYNFKIVDGGVWRSCNTTISNTAINYELDKANVDGNDVVLETGEAGTYIFQYSYFDDKHHITVYYPQARLKKGSYLYVDARNTNWVNNGGVGFGARYFYKYYDSGTDLETGNQVDCTTPLEYQVHYSIVPDNDYVGQVQIERKKPTKMDSTRWDYAQNIAAYSRTSSMQNCLSMENATGGTWSNFAPVWSTYCPIKKSTTITDNGTVTYGGNGESGTPYLVEKGTKIKVSAASEDYIEDTNMTTKYNFYDKGVSKQNGEGTTYEFTSAATAGIEYRINVNGYNYYNETASSNQFSTLLYYQTVTCHTVTYNANGGTGSLPAASGSKYVAGTNVTLATNAGGDAGSLERDGYVFIGWNTAANGSGTHYDAGATLTGIGDNVLLYAHWVALTTPTVTPTTTNWAGSNVDISLSATSTYLSEPVVVFYVNDGTNTYEVMGAPYGSDGSSLGAIGAVGSSYSTLHKATFTATTYGTYTVTAKLFEGKFIDNFEGSASAWSGLGYGTCERVSNVEREADNGSTKVMKITRSVEDGHGETYQTAWTTTEENSGTKTSWGHEYGYIHMRYYAPQEETPEVEYWDDGESVFKNTTLSSQTASTWHELVFAVDGGVVNYIHPFVLSGGKTDGHYIYIDDVVLSNEETMTAKVTTTSASTTIYSLSSVTVDPTSSADYFDTPIDISLSATSTGLENSVVVFLVNDGTTTFEVVGTPGTPGGSPSYTTEHTATFTTTTPGNYTVTAKVYEAKLIDNFDGLSAYWKVFEGASCDASASNPSQQAANGSSTVMQITRGDDVWKTVQTKQAADNSATTNWNLDYGYIYISMYSTTARATKMKYSDDFSGTEVTSSDLSASMWTRVKFTVGSGHQVDYILPFMPTEGTMYIDDIILSNESSMTVKASSVGDATAFRVNDNKYYFTGNNKSSTAWNTAANWNRGEVPSSTSEVFILAPVEIATGTTVHVDKVNIVTGGSITPPNGSSMTASGHLTIAPNAGLNVTGKIRKIADGAYPNTRIATTPADLLLESSSAGNASLIFENDANQATVQMYSKASIPNENTWNWQFMGIPFTSTNALYSYYNSYLYEWQSSGTWTEVANGGTMSPFTGYCITQTAATTYVMDGTLTPNNDVAISIPAGKEFVMANSWSAPILVSGFTNTTLPLTNKTIYLYNTGYNPEGGAAVTEGTESGTYVAIPIHAAPYTGNDLIAPMQGFYVDNTSGSAATITLKYNELVRPSVDRSIIAGPMHAPEKGVLENAQEDNRPVVLKLWANGAVYNDRAVLLERSDFSLGFDNGWDGKKLSFGEVGPSVYVINPLGEPEAVSAIPDLEGTLVGFRAGTNNTCTMSFEYNGEDTFYLNDLQAQQSTQIASENSYTFTCTAGDNEARFIISATPISKTPTDVESLTAHPSPLTVTKVLLNNHIYIIRDGRMFSMDGTLVK